MSEIPVKLLDEKIIFDIHEQVLADSGGLTGLAPDKSLSATVKRIEDDIFYNATNNIYDVAALYGFAIVKGHAFNDGNKRTAMVTMIDFLTLNGIDFHPPFQE